MPSSLMDLSHLPATLRDTLTNCGGIILDLKNRLSNLTLQKKEQVLEYIAICFPQLKRLLLGNNDLESLPTAICNLTHLTQLNLSANQLSTLPESIGNLTRLTQLNLSANQLSALPESIGKLSHLMELDLSNNQLSTLPESIGNLTRLTRLVLFLNKLSALPESIGKLAQLTTLSLHNNQLSASPESIGNLTQLTGLSLSYNKLSTLPESIGNLTQLNVLNLVGNLLKSLPLSMLHLSEAMLLLLAKNPLCFPPQKIIESLEQNNDSYRPIKNFFQQVFEKYAPDLLEIQQAKSLLAFSRISKEHYALIQGRPLIASKEFTSKEKDTKEKPEETMQPLPPLTWLPPELRQQIFLQAVEVKSANQRRFMKGFRELVKDKSNRNIMRFLNETSPNWEEAIKCAYEKEREGVSLNR